MTATDESQAFAAQQAMINAHQEMSKAYTALHADRTKPMDPGLEKAFWDAHAAFVASKAFYYSFP